MIYVVERYLPGLEHSELLSGLRQLQQLTGCSAEENAPVRYLGSTIVLGDDACYCRFEAPSPDAVLAANRRVRLPVDRIVATVTVTPALEQPDEHPHCHAD